MPAKRSKPILIAGVVSAALVGAAALAQACSTASDRDFVALDAGEDGNFPTDASFIDNTPACC